jgi:hypothetical protein
MPGSPTSAARSANDPSFSAFEDLSFLSFDDVDAAWPTPDTRCKVAAAVVPKTATAASAVVSAATSLQEQLKYLERICISDVNSTDPTRLARVFSKLDRETTLQASARLCIELHKVRCVRLMNVCVHTTAV